jgi:hypothetical protein
LGADFTNRTRAASIRDRIDQAIAKLGRGASRAADAQKASVSTSSVSRYRRAVRGLREAPMDLPAFAEAKELKAEWR